MSSNDNAGEGSSFKKNDENDGKDNTGNKVPLTNAERRKIKKEEEQEKIDLGDQLENLIQKKEEEIEKCKTELEELKKKKNSEK